MHENNCFSGSVLKSREIPCVSKRSRSHWNAGAKGEPGSKAAPEFRFRVVFQFRFQVLGITKVFQVPIFGPPVGSSRRDFANVLSKFSPKSLGFACGWLCCYMASFCPPPPPTISMPVSMPKILSCEKIVVSGSKIG